MGTLDTMANSAVSPKGVFDRKIRGGSWGSITVFVRGCSLVGCDPYTIHGYYGFRVACEPEVESRSLRGGSWFISYPYMNIPIRGGDLVTTDWRHTFSFRVACRAEPRLFVIRSCPWKLYYDYAGISIFTCLTPTHAESSALGFRVCYEDDG